MYQVTIRGLPLKQAQALYRFMVDLDDAEPFHGDDGATWSGVIPDHNRPGREHIRTVTIEPMVDHKPNKE